MRLWALDGKEHAGKLTTDHPSSSYAIPVIVIEFTAEEREKLERHGFETAMTIDRPLPKWKP